MSRPDQSRPRPPSRPDQLPTRVPSPLGQSFTGLPSSPGQSRARPESTDHSQSRPRLPSRPGQPRPRLVIARAANGQSQTYCLAPANAHHIPYRRLALAILRLDVATLASELVAARRLPLPRAA